VKAKTRPGLVRRVRRDSPGREVHPAHRIRPAEHPNRPEALHLADRPAAPNLLEVLRLEAPNLLALQEALPESPAARLPDTRRQDAHRLGPSRLEEHRQAARPAAPTPAVRRQDARHQDARLPPAEHRPEARPAGPNPPKVHPARPAAVHQAVHPHLEAHPGEALLAAPNRPAVRRPGAHQGARRPEDPNRPAVHRRPEDPSRPAEPRLAEVRSHPVAARIRVHGRSASFEHPPWPASRQVETNQSPNAYPIDGDMAMPESGNIVTTFTSAVTPCPGPPVGTMIPRPPPAKAMPLWRQTVSVWVG